MKELLRYTPKEHKDHENIDNCYLKTQLVAEYVNDRKKILENLQKMREIRDKLVDIKGFTIITPSRGYVREALLGKVNNYGKLQDRYFFLFSDCLVYTVPHVFKKTYQYKGHIMLNQCSVSELTDTAKYEHAFAITRIDSKKRYLMVFQNEKVKRTWMFDILKIIDVFLQRGNEDRKTLSRHSSTKRNSAPMPFTKSQENRESMDFTPQLVLIVKASDLMITSRVTLESKVEAVIMRLKLKVPGNTENFKLFLGNEPLDPGKKMGDYPRLRYMAEALNMSHEVEMEFRE